MRVLVVDDEPLAQTALANILNARRDVEHFEAASDAIEALEKLAGKATDLPADLAEKHDHYRRERGA